MTSTDGALAANASEEVFASPEEMADALESLVFYLNHRYVKRKALPHNGVLGFVIESLKVEFSSAIQNLEIVTNFAENSATILAPSSTYQTEEDQDQRRAELLKFFFPTLKDAQLRSTVQLFKTLRLSARVQLVKNYRSSVRSDAKSRQKAKKTANEEKVILVVENERDLRQIVHDILVAAGYRVDTATNGKEALEYLAHHPAPSLIILDLDMPVMNGFEFCNIRRADPKLLDIPLLIHSGKEPVPDTMEGLGADGYLIKTLDPHILTEVVACTIEGRETSKTS